METESRTGYKDYQIKVFQKNVLEDIGKQIRLDHKGSTDYTLMSIRPYKGELQTGRKEVSAYVLTQLLKMKSFITKHDALIYGQSMQNLVYALHRYQDYGSTVDGIELRLTGGDKEGYGIDFLIIKTKG